jgi:hypothetical protein
MVYSIAGAYFAGTDVKLRWRGRNCRDSYPSSSCYSYACDVSWNIFSSGNPLIAQRRSAGEKEGFYYMVYGNCGDETGGGRPA